MNALQMPRSITVRNAQRKLPVDVAALRSFAEVALREAVLEVSDAAIQHIDVVLVSNKKIAAVHKQFMGIDGPTDVITFQHGEIVVSVETAAAQAVEHKSSFVAELRLYIVHGILHLLGFDDTTQSAARRMEKMQAKIVTAAASVL